MTSSDREILIEVAGEVKELRRDMNDTRERLGKLEQRVGVLEERTSLMHDSILVQSTQVDMLIWAVGIGFGLLAVMIAFVGVFMPLFLSRREKPEHKPDIKPEASITPSEILRMIHSELEMHSAKMR